MKKILMIVLAVVALQLGVVSATYASGGGDGGTYHKVHYGETLYSIGRQYDRHPLHIAEVNGLYNPNVIYAGQVLYIPTGSRYPWEAHDGCGNDCGYGHGWQKSGYNQGNCGWNDCNNQGWQRSGHRNDCGWNNCDNSGWQHSDWNNNCGWNNCNNSGWQKSGWNNCGGNNCNSSGHYDKCGGNNCNSSHWGYDYTGYYYGNYQKRYSYSCGYYSNCW